MLSEIRRALKQYPPPVLTWIDAGGYPFSVRCAVAIDEAAGIVRLTAADPRLTAGAANLVLHRHDEQLWHIQHVTILGALEQDAVGWLFRPERILPGLGYHGVRGQLQFMWQGRRAARRYLARRGLARPRIPWDEIKALWAQIKRDRA